MKEENNISTENVLANVHRHFNISIGAERIRLVPLKCCGWLEAEKYPVFTLIGQALGGLVVGIEALYRFVPCTFVDTIGCPFSLPLMHYMAGCKVACYVHYPVISTDMITLVNARTCTYNNAAFVTNSALLSTAKLIYYRLFSCLYAFAGRSR